MNPKPNASLPKVMCDFNACGWSGEHNDDCYYAFDQQAVAALNPHEGLRLFIYDDEGDGQIIGFEGVLEHFNTSWRIRPDRSTWFEGRLD